VPAPEALYTAAANAQVVNAPLDWRAIDFVSDLHLQASQVNTFAAFENYLAHTPADALFILGDLFEVWVGDDLLHATGDPDVRFIQRCQQVLRAAASRMRIYFLHGNRDFLLGQDGAAQCGMQLLADPSVLDFDDQRWLVSHGDALCLNDVDYQQFRHLVRSNAWQTDFLSKPLNQRQQIARSLRDNSEARKSSGARYADVDAQAARDWLRSARASVLIHGHTHRPADHVLEASAQAPLRRLVLSDWDADAQPPRLEVLRLKIGQAPQRLTLNQAQQRSGLASGL
jgi:UDP-2,3-diacylglucosamine hydrolase